MVVEAMQIQTYHNMAGPLQIGNNNHNHNHNLTSNNMNSTSNMDYTKIGRTVKNALLKAQIESRVIVGLSAAIKVLSKAAEGSLFCIMAVPQDGDSATHMQQVLLEAFCYENDIYVIKVDCPMKLSRILGKTTIESCCLVQKTWTGDHNEESLNKLESLLVDHCEAFWDSPQKPIIQLPNV
ncbi:growth arrest and DNA damage-inducible 45 isoform 1-T1 [Cochliomyia hominivorax]